jgi:hypothetical protein
VRDEGCWWGVSATDNEKELEISFRNLSQKVNVLLTSSPTTVMELSASPLCKLFEWWCKAKRHAAQHFWGPGESSIMLLLVVGGIKAERFLHCNRILIQGSETARVRVGGRIDKETGRLFLTTNSEWDLEVNGLDLGVSKSERQQTCGIAVLASRIFKLPEDEYHHRLARQVWRYVLDSVVFLREGHTNYQRLCN